MVFASLSVAKVLKKHLRSSWFLVKLERLEACNVTPSWVFSRKIHMKNLPNGYFYYLYFTPIFLAADRKINKIYQQKLKPGDRQ